MARGVNKVILIGNVGQDPETRAMPSGRSVVNLRLATSESWRDKQTGEQKEQTEWHTVVMFDRLAEIAAEYLRKGSQVYIEGRIRTRKWQDKEGKERYSTEIVANEMQMLGGRGDRASGLAAAPAPRPQRAKSRRRAAAATSSRTTSPSETPRPVHWGRPCRCAIPPEDAHTRRAPGLSGPAPTCCRRFRSSPRRQSVTYRRPARAQ